MPVALIADVTYQNAVYTLCNEINFFAASQLNFAGKLLQYFEA